MRGRRHALLVLLLLCGAGCGEEAAPVEPTGALRGRVLDDAGRPVSGARVFVSEWPDGLHPVGDAATSGPDGSWSLEGLPLGVYGVFAEVEGHARSIAAAPVALDTGEAALALVPERPTEVPGGLEMTGVDVRLERAGVLRVALATEDERWRVATVTAVRSEEDRIEAERLGGAVTEKLEEHLEFTRRGTVEIPGAAVGVWNLTVERLGWPTIRRPDIQIEAERTAEVRVEFPASAEISGRVLDDGDACGRSTIEVWRRDDAGAEFDRLPTGIRAPEGRFHVEGLDPESRYVLVASPWDVERFQVFSAPVEVAAGARDVVLAIRRAGELRGRVVREETGKPVPGVAIQPVRQEKFAGHRTGPDGPVRTRPDGTFHVGFLAPGRYRLHLTPEDASLILEERPTCEIRADETTDLGDVKLRLGAEVWGSIRVDGEVPGGPLAVGMQRRPALPMPRWSRGDERGKYRIVGLPAGRYDLVVYGREQTGWVLRFRTLEVARQRRERVDLSIPGGGALLLRVASRRFAPIGGARVTVRDAEGRTIPTGSGMPPEEVDEHASCWRKIVRQGDQPNVLWPWAEAASVTGEEGRLCRGTLPPGRYAVEIEAEGYEPRTIEVEIEDRRIAERTVTLSRSPR